MSGNPGNTGSAGDPSNMDDNRPGFPRDSNARSAALATAQAQAQAFHVQAVANMEKGRVRSNSTDDIQASIALLGEQVTSLENTVNSAKQQLAQLSGAVQKTRNSMTGTATKPSGNQ